MNSKKLSSSFVSLQVAAVELLLQHGADAKAKTQDDLSILGLFARALKYVIFLFFRFDQLAFLRVVQRCAIAGCRDVSLSVTATKLGYDEPG